MPDLEGPERVELDMETIIRKAEVIIENAEHFKDNPHDLYKLSHSANKIGSSVSTISASYATAIKAMREHRMSEGDNPNCENCGAEKELAVTSSNMQGYLCPNCDIQDQ